MAEDGKGRLEKITKLLGVLTELREKEQALVDEIAELAGGGVGIGAKLKAFEATWQRVWSARYQSDYVFQWAKDRALEKRLLKVFALDDLDARAVRYLADDDPFYVKSRHPFGLFVSAINRFATDRPGTGMATSEDGPIGCHHDPPCRTDSEHTRVRRAEMRS